MKKSYKGCGRPVLVSCHTQYETLPGSGMMIIIPTTGGFGAATYFRDEPKISHKVFCDEFDGCHCGYQYEDFVQASDKILLTHLTDSRVTLEFYQRALELISECPLEE